MKYVIVFQVKSSIEFTPIHRNTEGIYVSYCLNCFLFNALEKQLKWNYGIKQSNIKKHQLD